MMDQAEQFGEPEYLGWSLLVHLKDQSNDQISRSKFLKLCCITDRYLLEKHDYDVGLPRYWYMYGELANQHEFSGRFFNASKAISRSRTSRSKISTSASMHESSLIPV
jgi:hypothetical protein